MIAFIFGWKLALVIIAFVPIVVFSELLRARIIKGTGEEDAKLLERTGESGGWFINTYLDPNLE